MHNIIHWVYPEKTSINKIESEVVNYVHSHGDRYGTERIEILSTMPFDNMEQADTYIREMDSNFYGGYAVKFYDYSNAKDTKKTEELKSKLANIMHKKSEYIANHHVRNFKASYVGCSKCGSKINKQYLNVDKCPVCYQDLRAESVLECIKNYDKRIIEYQEKIQQEIQKQKDKAKINWLIKFEYHS